MHVKDFLRGACVRPVAVGVVLSILIVCIRRMGQPGDWLHLILHGVLAGASMVAVVLVVGITAEERHQFLVQPMRRLLKREIPVAVDGTR